MQTKLLLILLIVVMLMIYVFVQRSRKQLWQKENTLHSRIITLRSIVMIAIVILFLVFSVLK